MPVYTTFKDYFTTRSPSKGESSVFKDYYAASGRKKLIVKMEATHAAIENKNDRFYLPSRMAEGVISFRTGSHKPTKVLKHHDAYSDPVGKVVQAQFVPTIPDDLQGNPEIETLMSVTASVPDQLKAMRTLKRFGVLDREDWKGLGYIDLVTEISDETTVKQLEDGLFDAVSTNFSSPGEIYCSICGRNIVKDDWCEHEPGELYYADGKNSDSDIKFVCQWIPAKHDYKEVSFVVFDADQLTVVEILDSEKKDDKKIIYLSEDSKRNLKSADLTFQFKDSVEEGLMKIKINGKEVSLSDAEQKLFSQIKKMYSDEMKDEDAYALMIKTSKLIASKQFIADKKASGIEDEKSTVYAIEACANEDKEIKAEEISDGIRKELKAMQKEELLNEEDFKTADAKFSKESIAKLPDSVFCGPDKTFPVPDSAHAIAAKRFLDSYSGKGNKVSILAQIDTKQKAFGKGVVKNIPAKDPELSKKDGLDSLSDSELQDTYHKVEKALIERKLVLKRECSECATHLADAKKTEEKLEVVLKDKEQSDNIVNVLRSELKRAYSDYEKQVDEYVKVGAELYTAKLDKVALVSVLTNKYDSLDIAKTELKDSDLDAKATAILESFDLTAITDKLNDGMAKNPKGSVSDPTANNDKDNKQHSVGLSRPAEEAILNIKDCLKDGDISGARRIYDTMKALEMFPDEITFESLSADSKKPAE